MPVVILSLWERRLRLSTVVGMDKNEDAKNDESRKNPKRQPRVSNPSLKFLSCPIA